LEGRWEGGPRGSEKLGETDGWRDGGWRTRRREERRRRSDR